MALPDAPQTRSEEYLNAVATQDSSGLPDAPLSRIETYLAAMAGEDVTLPDAPQTRIEQYLDYIVENGSGGGGNWWALLGSGSFTRTYQEDDRLIIPVTYTGTPHAIFICAAEYHSGVAYEHCAFKIIDVPEAVATGFGSQNGVICDRRCIQNGGQVLSGGGGWLIAIQDGNIVAQKMSQTYPWLDEPYNWFIYGEAST